MNVQVNGETRSVPEGSTLSDLIRELGLTAGRLACEVNGSIVKRADYGRTPLRANDALEIVQMIGGG